MALLATALLLSATPAATTATKPHIIAILADDYGWADAGWHREPGYKEVQTPIMDGLVKSGIEMDRHYVFKFCSPTRSAAQTGRNPIHVNVQNLDPNNYNPADPVSGMSAVPRNMTGVAEVMKRAGYVTAFYGKWDCGMATMRHTPRGRGYDDAMHYFHHMEDYWQSVFQNGNGDTEFWAACSALKPDFRPRDLWLANATYEGPAVDLVNPDPSCTVFGDSENHTFDLCPMGAPADKGKVCPPYPGFPGEQHAGCTYVDETFATHALASVTKHDATDTAHPLYMFWAPHIVHSPLQVPKVFLEKFDFIDDWRRQRYHAMVNLMDTKIGDVVDALKTKGMYDNTVLFFSADNGGPIYGDGSAGANNYPLRGGKATNWEGGVRVNAWVSGGYIQPSRRGVKLEGLSTIWDWYTTFAHIGGIDDVTDHAAAESGLPPVDGVNLWPYIAGDVKQSPRTEVLLGTGATAINGIVAVDTTTSSSPPKLWKRLEGGISQSGWTGPECPNATYKTPGGGQCHPFCLFDLTADPTEHVDLANSTDPAAVEQAKALGAKMVEGRKHLFAPDRGSQDPQSCIAAVQKFDGWWGPWRE